MSLQGSGGDVKLTLDRTDKRTYSIYTESNNEFRIRDEDASADRFWISSAGASTFGGTVKLGNNSILSDATTSSVFLNSSGDVLLTAVQSGAVFAVKTWNGSTQAERFKISGAGATATTTITGNATITGNCQLGDSYVDSHSIYGPTTVLAAAGGVPFTANQTATGSGWETLFEAKRDGVVDYRVKSNSDMVIVTNPNNTSTAHLWFQVNNAYRLKLNASGLVEIPGSAGDLTVGGDTTVSGALAVGANTTLSTNGSGHTLFGNNTANKDMNYTVTGTGGHYFSGSLARFLCPVKIVASGLGINLDTPSSGQNCWVTWNDNGTAKWEIGKNTANKLYIHNYAASASALEFDSLSNATFGGNVGIKGTSGGSQKALDFSTTNLSGGTTSNYWIYAASNQYWRQDGSIKIPSSFICGDITSGAATFSGMIHAAKSVSAGETVGLFIENTAGSAVGNKAVLAFGTDAGATSTNNPRIEVVNTNASNGASKMVFKTHASGGNITEAFRLNSDASATFSGIATAGTFRATGKLVSADNIFMAAGQFYLGAENGSTNDTYRMYHSSGSFLLQSRESGNWTSRFTIDTSGNSTFGGAITATGITIGSNDVATESYCDTYTDQAIAQLVDSSPSTLNTLNELAAAPR